MSVIIQTEDFNVAHEYAQLCQAAPQAGAVVFFVGLVRELYSDGRKNESSGQVDYIELSHYSGMTEALCEDIVDRANSQFPFESVRIVHRVGKLYSQDQIVFVAVASKHRKNAFAAAQYIMDYLKTEATLWKKEVGSRGEQWLGIKAQDKLAIERWQSDRKS